MLDKIPDDNIVLHVPVPDDHFADWLQTLNLICIWKKYKNFYKNEILKSSWKN